MQNNQPLLYLRQTSDHRHLHTPVYLHLRGGVVSKESSATTDIREYIGTPNNSRSPTDYLLTHVVQRRWRYFRVFADHGVLRCAPPRTPDVVDFLCSTYLFLVRNTYDEQHYYAQRYHGPPSNNCYMIIAEEVGP